MEGKASDKTPMNAEEIKRSKKYSVSLKPEEHESTRFQKPHTGGDTSTNNGQDGEEDQYNCMKSDKSEITGKAKGGNGRDE